MRNKEKVAKCASAKAAMETAAGFEAESIHAHELRHPYYKKSIGADKSPYEKVLANTLKQKRDTALTLENAAKLKLSVYQNEHEKDCKVPTK